MEMETIINNASDSVCHEVSKVYNVSQITTDVNLAKLATCIWKELSNDPKDIDELKNNYIDIDGRKAHFINWNMLSLNPLPEAVNLLEQYPQFIDWNNLSLNPGAIRILKRNPDKIQWRHLSINSGAMEIIKSYPHNIHWETLALNEHPEAKEMLKNRQI